MLISAEITSKQHDLAFKTGVLSLQPLTEDIDKCPVNKVWAKTFKGDILVSIMSDVQKNPQSTLSICLYHISEKGIMPDCESGDNNFKAALAVKRIEIVEVKNFNFWTLKNIVSIGSELNFDEINSLLDKSSNKSTIECPKNVNSIISSFEYRGVTCKIENLRDFSGTIDQFIKLHHYGVPNYFVRLIAEHRGRLFGVALLDLNRSEHDSNAAQGGFGMQSYEFLKHNFILLRRMIVPKNKLRNKFVIQKALIKASKKVAHVASDKQIKLLVGNSFDYQPACIDEGFVCEIPTDPKNALFYWFPLSGFVNFDRDRFSAKRKVREYLKRRKDLDNT